MTVSLVIALVCGGSYAVGVVVGYKLGTGRWPWESKEREG